MGVLTLLIVMHQYNSLIQGKLPHAKINWHYLSSGYSHRGFYFILECTVPLQHSIKMDASGNLLISIEQANYYKLGTTVKNLETSLRV